MPDHLRKRRRGQAFARGRDLDFSAAYIRLAVTYRR
jgi:hypothetical protein